MTQVEGLQRIRAVPLVVVVIVGLGLLLTRCPANNKPNEKAQPIGWALLGSF
jgi:hypothetical protein